MDSESLASDRIVRALVNSLARGFKEGRPGPDGKTALPFGVGGEFCESEEIDGVSNVSSHDNRLLGSRWHKVSASGSKGGSTGGGVERRACDCN